MDTGYITIIAILLAIVAFRLFGKKPPEGKKSNAGWVALFVLGTLFTGLVLAGAAGNETLTWLFGLSLMLAFPLLLLLAIGTAVGALFKRDRNEKP